MEHIKHRNPQVANLKRVNNSFTLIELLIVIAIIAILAAVIVVSTSNARTQARDARRTQDLDQLKTALEMYYYDNNYSYPYGNIGPEGSNSENGFCIEAANDTNSQFKTLLQSYLVTIPRDPLYNPSQCSSPYSTTCYCYVYKTDTNQKFKFFTKAEQQNYRPAQQDGGTEPNLYEVYANISEANKISWPGYFQGEEGGGTGSAWLYNKTISLSNSTSSTLQNYQVQITVSYEQNKMQPDFKDIRFSDKYGNFLPYWLKTKIDSSSATYYVKVNSISSPSDTILVWYGNPYATYIGSYDNTFDKSLKLTATGTTDSNLKGEWLMDDATGTTVTDTSGNNNTGTYFGSSLSFDGVNDYVNCGNNASLNAYPISIEVWIKTTDSGSNKGVVNKYVGSSFNGYQIYINNGRIKAWYFRDISNYTRQDADADDGGLINDGNWHHIVYTVDGSGGKIYVDNILKNSKPWVGTAGVTTTTRYLNMSEYNSAYFNGLIDEVRIYNQALDAATIAKHYRGDYSSDPSGSLVMYQAFNESSVKNGTTLTNDGGSCGTSCNGTFNDPDNTEHHSTSTPALWQQPSNTAPWDSQAGTYFSTNSSALKFNGVDDYVSFSQPSIGTSPNLFTIEGWIKPGNQYSRFLTPQSNGVDQFLHYLPDSQILSVHIAEKEDTNERDRSSSLNSVPINQWTNFAVIIDNLNIKIFINGVLNAQYNETIPIANWTGNWILGQRGIGTNWYLGLIDEVRVYNRALSVNEIRAHYEHRKCADPSRADCGVTATVQ